MQFISVVSCSIILLAITATAAETSNSTYREGKILKPTEKVSYPKKVNSLKKNSSKASLKKIADITDKFKDLPADDLEFIKELDKQFKLHGGKIKIKVENNNATESKTSKRTIDGELGYGYSHNGYEYNPPKYMFYPYSQQNIENKASSHFLIGDGKTEVTIEPSYSYELRPQTYVTQNEPHIDVPKTEHHSVEQQSHYEEPVIVLRIPGPAKYASHLQMLLQKYLEIRAAQYLRILEEAEQRNNHLQQVEYNEVTSNAAANEGHIEHTQTSQAQQLDFNQQVQYEHQIAVNPQPIQYPDIDNVYRNYKQIHAPGGEQYGQEPQDQPTYLAQHQSDVGQHPIQYQQHEQHHVQYEQQPEQQQQQQFQQPQEEEPPQYYYTHQQQYAHPDVPPANAYQNVYLLSMTSQVHAGYHAALIPEQKQQQQQQPQHIYVQEQQLNQNEHYSPIPITENNPRPSHTKIVFTTNSEKVNPDYQMHQLPSIKPNERYPPNSVPDYHQDFQQQQQATEEQHYSSGKSVAQQVVSVTQRPFNYHAHSVKMRARGRTAHKGRSINHKNADQGLQKIRDYVREKLGAETGSAVEFKTTQILDG